jgi:hypothetical protein
MRPTFDSWSDRAVYLIAEAQLLVVGLATIAGVLLYLWSPSLPAVPVIVTDGLAVALLGGPIPALVGYRGARKLAMRSWPTVYQINAVEDVREKWRVPPDVWSDRNSSVAPNVVNDGDDYEVRRLEWFPEASDEGRLSVTGTWPAEVKDSALITSRTYIEEIHEHLTDSLAKLAELRAKWSRMSLDLQEELINKEAEALERGQMLQKTAAKTIYENERDDAEELEAEDLPSIEENWRHDPDDQSPEPPEGATNGEVTADGGR